MRVKVGEFEVLREATEKLRDHGQHELAGKLQMICERLDGALAVEREGNRERARKNREAGYLWKSGYHPNKKSEKRAG